MTFRLGPRSLGNMTGLHPQLAEIVMLAITVTQKDFGIAGNAVRSAEEQKALYLKGVTQKDGYRSKSNHQPLADGFGHAVDLTPYEGEFILDNRAWVLYPFIASAMSKSAHALGLANRLKWGCDWYRTMDQYGQEPGDMLSAMAHYQKAHPGKDFLDGPHFELN